MAQQAEVLNIPITFPHRLPHNPLLGKESEEAKL